MKASPSTLLQLICAAPMQSRSIDASMPAMPAPGDASPRLRKNCPPCNQDCSQGDDCPAWGDQGPTHDAVGTPAPQEPLAAPKP